jgi:hypothetical protein
VVEWDVKDIWSLTKLYEEKKMKLKTCYLVVRVFKSKELQNLETETKKLILEKGGEQKVLPDPEMALTTTDPYTEEEEKEEPSSGLNNCLVSVRFWYSVFDGPAVSIIIVGPSRDVSSLKGMFIPLCQIAYDKGRIYDNREKFDISERNFDIPEDFDWQNKYYYAELLAKDLQEDTINLSYSGPTLWDEVKDLIIKGERLSGESEILHEIEDTIRQEDSTANRAQIQKVLENVPHVFPEDWKSPKDYRGLNLSQKIIYRQLAGLGFRLTVPEIERIIKLAIKIRDDCNKSVQ